MNARVEEVDDQEVVDVPEEEEEEEEGDSDDEAALEAARPTRRGRTKRKLIADLRYLWKARSRI
jgi:hypothetical protein